MAETLLDAIFTIDRDGRIVECNSDAEQMFGYRGTDVAGRDLAELIFPTSLHALHRQRLERFTTAQQSPEMASRQQLTAMRANRAEFPVELVMIRIPRAEPALCTVYIRDMTEHRRAEQDLRQDLERYRNIVEISQEGIWQIDANGYTTYVNQRMADMLCYTVDEMLGTSPFDYLDAEGTARVRANQHRRAAAAREGRGFDMRYEFELLRKDGTRIWACISVVSFYGPAGQHTGSCAMVTDISDRKQIEDSLRASEQNLRTFLANAPILLWAIDASGLYTLFEGPQLRRFGYEPGALVGASIWDTLQPFPELTADIRRALAGEEVVTLRHTHGWVYETRYARQHDKDGSVSGLIGVSTDVT
ncbi:MAG: domain S-box protein, partial [Chloroflexi bacterium]|nr:domain S-box protein [Chloroflexota bacterium]